MGISGSEARSGCRRPAACGPAGPTPGRREVRVERGPLVVVEVVSLVIDHEVQHRALGERGRLVEDQVAVFHESP